MAKLNELAHYIRSKNAGPFWLTIDIFFEDEENYRLAASSDTLTQDTVASVYGVPAELVKLFHIDTLQVIKISFPRFSPQGSPGERDMHGGQQYVLLSELEIKER